MKKLFITILLSVLIINSQVVAESSEFKIGAMLCLTGDCAEWGNNSLKGIRLAIKELNAKGGVLSRKISLILEDTREGAGGSNAINAYQNLILNEDLQYIVGPSWSIGGAPLAPIVAKNKNIIITSPSLGIADFNQAGDQIFNLWPHDSYSSEELAAYAIKQGWKKSVIFEANDPWGVVQADTFEKKFKELGGEIMRRISNPPDATSFRSEALLAKQSQPDFIFQANLYKLSQFAKDLERISFAGKQITILMDETRIREASGALEGVVYARYAHPADEFIKSYQQEYNEKPGVTADTAYDLIYLYAKAISEAGSFDPLVVKGIIQKSHFVGASGEVFFDSKGGVVKSPLIYHLVNQQEVRVPDK